MSQQFSLYEQLTVDQNIRFFGGIYGIPPDRYAERRRFVLEMAGLDGREQTLAARPGRRLAAAPGARLRDPARAADPLPRRADRRRRSRSRAAQFWRLIDQLSRSGVTVLVTTHYLDEAEYCHRIAIIHAGQAGGARHRRAS